MNYSLLIFFIIAASNFVFCQDKPFIMTYDLGLGEPRLTFGTSKQRTASISLGDVDGDGDTDAVIANGRHWPEINAVYFNTNNRFTSFMQLGNVHSTSYGAELADMDNDGDLDIVEANDMAPHRLYINDGKGQFIFHSIIARPSSARNVILADIDNNSFTDIIICNRGEQNIICYNEGALSFQCENLKTDKNATIDIEVSDLNKDGRPDLILANRNRIPNAIYLNKGGRVFEKYKEFGTGSYETRSIEIADINNDGIKDIITGNINGANVIYLGDEALTYSKTISFGNNDVDTYAVAVADFNKDGFVDILAGNYKKPAVVFYEQRPTFI